MVPRVRFERTIAASKADGLSVSLTGLGGGTGYRAQNRLLMRQPRRLLLPPAKMVPIDRFELPTPSM